MKQAKIKDLKKGDIFSTPRAGVIETYRLLNEPETKNSFYAFIKVKLLRYSSNPNIEGKEYDWNAYPDMDIILRKWNPR